MDEPKIEIAGKNDTVAVIMKRLGQKCKAKLLKILNHIIPSGEILEDFLNSSLWQHGHIFLKWRDFSMMSQAAQISYIVYFLIPNHKMLRRWSIQPIPVIIQWLNLWKKIFFKLRMQRHSTNTKRYQKKFLETRSLFSQPEFLEKCEDLPKFDGSPDVTGRINIIWSLFFPERLG